MPTLISSLVLQSNWTPSGETTTGVLLFQSLLEENQNDCQFLVRLKFGMNGLQTPIYTENKGIFLEPGSSALIDFRSLVPDTLSFNDPNIRWIIETRLGFNFSPINVKIQEFDSLSFENELTLAALNAKAEKIHNHQISDIQSLTESLLGKLDKPLITPTEGQIIQFLDGSITWSDLTVFATPIQWQKLTANASLEPGKKYFVKGGSEFTLPATVSELIEVSNQTTSIITIVATGTARINGISTDNSTAISQKERVRIKPGKSAKLIADGGNWESQDCDNPFLVFTYNGNPLTPNSENPNGASDLIHWIGGVGAFVNPATNSRITVATSSVFGSAGDGTVTTDRVANPTNANQNWYPNNQANSWIAWQFPKGFSPTGLLIQTSGVSGNPFHLRGFDLRYSNDVSNPLTSSSSVASWAVGKSWINQAQINTLGSHHFFPAIDLPSSRRWAIFVTQPDSAGNNYPTIAEVGWFGNYFD